MRLSCKIILNFVTYINFYSNMQNIQNMQKKEKKRVSTNYETSKYLFKCIQIYLNTNLGPSIGQWHNNSNIDIVRIFRKS